VSIEALRNIIHREVQRFLDRRTRRVPCIVDSYNPSQHTVKVKLQPEGTLTGWLQIETAQVGLQIAPNIGDPGWLEFHEADRRAAVFVGSNHNDLNPPPKEIQAGEAYYQNKSGSSVYFKGDGSITATDKSGSSYAMDGTGNVAVTGETKITLDAPVIVLDGAIWVEGTLTGVNGAGSISIGVPINQTAGSFNTSGDVVARSISLTNHVHSGVEPGASDTGPATG
jgi:phage baseplate assembly protein V